MKNVEYEISKDKKTLTVTVDLSKRFGKSKSGKTDVISSTEGNKQVTDGIFMGLNVYEKPKT